MLSTAMPGRAALPSGNRTRSCWDYRAAELSIARVVNRKRASHDIAKLRLDKHISRVSRLHTQEMIDAGELAHTPLQTLAGRVTNWIELGENIGRTTEGARRVLRAMMRSPVHRANILNPTFTYIGVGTKRTADRLWVTITFEAKDDPGTTLSMPRC